MRKPLRLSAFFLLLAVTVHSQNTIVKAGHLFDARSGKMLTNQLILIQNGKIKEVGASIKAGKGDTVIDLSDSWVLPGLMDCHVHITSNNTYRSLAVNETYTNESNAFRALRGAMVAKQLLENGFTTIKEIGNDAEYASADVIKAINRGWIEGPTIIYAGQIIAPFGGQSNGVNPEHEHFWKWEYLDADTPDEIKKAIRRNVYFGANVIKMVTGDNGIYDAADIKAAVDEAKKFNIKVTVHVAFSELAATNVIEGGAAAIEHGFALNNDQLQKMKDQHMYLVGTDFSFANWYAYGTDSASAKRLENIVVDRLKRAYKIGTPMAFGSDIIIDIPGLNRVQTNLEVLKTWKAAEIPPSYILQTMTIHAADLLGIGNERGVIEAKYAADIIALKSNPMTDIDAIKSVHFVMKDGKVVRRKAISHE